MQNRLKRLVAVALVTATLFCSGAALAAAPVQFGVNPTLVSLGTIRCKKR